MAKAKAKIKVLRKGPRCGNGWITIEILRKDKIERVCARIVRPKVKPKDMTWKDWADHTCHPCELDVVIH